jgi:Trk K+ transport system NAD-binding subunit
MRVLGVEFDPEQVRHLRHQGLHVRFGDAQDGDFLQSLPLQDIPWAMSTLPDLAPNKALLHALKVQGYPGQVALVARDDAQALALARLGSHATFNPSGMPWISPWIAW